MNVVDPGPAPAATRRRVSPELALGVAGLLTFVLVPVQINTVYEGLPAHPLFLHVPVILIPLAALGGLVLAARPRLFERHGIWMCALVIVALASINLTMGAGNQLRTDLGLNGGGSQVADLVARHAHAASILRVLLVLFTAVFIIAVTLYRHGDGKRSGIGLIDAILSGHFRCCPA